MVLMFRRVVDHNPSGAAYMPPSLLYNNLIFLEECGMLVYASRKDCVVIDVNKKKLLLLPLGSSDKELIVHCSATMSPKGLLHCDPAPLILITTHMSTQLWTAGSPLGLVPHDGANGMGCCSALVSTSVGCVHVVVGTSNGVVIFADCNAAATFVFSVNSAVKGHKEHSVTAVQLSPFSDSALFAVTGDTVGHMVFWNRDRQPFCALDTPECVTGLQIVSGGEFVVMADGSGKLQMFDSLTGEMRVTVCAHSRWINALSYNLTTNTLLSAAEDGYITLWSAPVKSANGITEVVPLVTHHIPDALPTGAAFTADGKHAVIALYDSETLTQYTFE